MADLRIVDAPVLLQESITDDVKMPTGGLGNFSIRLGDIVWYVVTKEQLANKNYVNSKDGDLTTLTTNDKTNLVRAINEVVSVKADKATTLVGYGISDAYTKGETYNRTEIDSRDGDLATLKTNDKTNLVKSINEVYDTTKGVVALYDKNVEAGAGANGWAATIIADESGMTQQQVNDKTALFYNTVADMVADTKLKAGKAVITHGYYTPNDGGGARYLIKDTATDYSIPIANNLHAVFADSFDIRKFGIRNSATLDQTNEIKRMCAYADKFVYEIDFLNFSLQVPKIWTPMKTWHRVSYPNGAAVDGTDFMGMAFTQVHKLKNLKITHDKTVRLENCHCMIIFAPMKNPDFEQWFDLESIEFDAWNPNYQPVTENYLGNGDGARHGFFVMPHNNGTVIANGEATTNFSIRYKNIHFKTPAYSYNLHTQIHLKNQEFENLTGEYTALYVLQFAYNFVGRNLTTIHRDDLIEANRVVVTNPIHYEAELGGKTATHNLVDIKNVNCIRKSTGLPYSSYVFHSLSPNITVNKFVLDNLNGHSSIFNTNVIDCEYKNSKEQSSFVLLGCPTVKKVVIDNWVATGTEGSFGTTPCLLKSKQIDYLEINNSDLQNPPHFNGVYTCNITKMVVNKTVINNTDGIGSGGDLTIENLEVDGLTLTETYSNITRSKITKATLKNVILQGETELRIMVQNYSDTTSVVDIINMVSKRKNAQWDFALVGKINATITNSSTTEILKADSNATRKFVNSLVQKTYVYDFASLNTASQQSIELTLDGAKLGDNIAVAFDKPLQGTRMWGEVISDNIIKVYHRNDTGAAVDLPSGTLTVKIV